MRAVSPLEEKNPDHVEPYPGLVRPHYGNRGEVVAAGSETPAIVFNRPVPCRQRGGTRCDCDTKAPS
jgi:hypothetical protein